MSNLKATPGQLAGSWEISRGKKVLAVVRKADEIEGSKLELVSGKCNLEDAKDAIWMANQLPVVREPVREPEPLHVVLRRHLTGHTPQVIVTLAAGGGLQVELPGVGTRRLVPLKAGEEGVSLRRMLEAQASGDTEIGTDGAPTSAQLRHWERHHVWADSRCRFCIAEGRAAAEPLPSKKTRRAEVIVKSAGVEIRRLTEVRKRAETAAVAAAPKTTTATLEEMGL